MQRRSIWRAWPLLVVALATACTDETTTPGTGGTGGTGGAGGTGGTAATGGTGGSAPKDGGLADTGAMQEGGNEGGTPDVTIPPGDGGLSPCPLDHPSVLDRPPSGSLPCELLPPGFVSP